MTFIWTKGGTNSALLVEIAELSSVAGGICDGLTIAALPPTWRAVISVAQGHLLSEHGLVIIIHLLLSCCDLLLAIVINTSRCCRDDCLGMSIPLLASKSHRLVLRLGLLTAEGLVPSRTCSSFGRLICVSGSLSGLLGCLTTTGKQTHVVGYSASDGITSIDRRQLFLIVDDLCTFPLDGCNSDVIPPASRRIATLFGDLLEFSSQCLGETPAVVLL